MTSYGRSFQYVPFTENVSTNLADLDSQILKEITKQDKEGFIKLISRTMAPLSGYSAILLAFQLLGPAKVKVEQHYHSGDINGNYTNTVGYAAIVLK